MADEILALSFLWRNIIMFAVHFRFKSGLWDSRLGKGGGGELWRKKLGECLRAPSQFCVCTHIVTPSSPALANLRQVCGSTFAQTASLSFDWHQYATFWYQEENWIIFTFKFLFFCSYIIYGNGKIFLIIEYYTFKERFVMLSSKDVIVFVAYKHPFQFNTSRKLFFQTQFLLKHSISQERYDFARKKSVYFLSYLTSWHHLQRALISHYQFIYNVRNLKFDYMKVLVRTSRSSNYFYKFNALNYLHQKTL